MHWLTLVLLSALCGAAAAFVFRRFASGDIRRTANRIVAHVMELWLFFDDPRLILKAQRNLLGENLRLFRQIAVPLAITAPLFALVMWQADAICGRGPLPAGMAAVVTVHVRTGDLTDIRLQTPSDVVIETPGVRVPAMREVSWRIRPVQDFSGSLTATGDVASIDIPWPHRSWVLRFLGISMISALLAAWFPKRHITMLLLIAYPASAAGTPPVILISIDTLRADHLSAYGYTKIYTPNIDAFADHGTIWTQIDAQVPLTLPSHAALMTSTYPFESRAEVNGDIVPPGSVTLASVLRANGYRTAAFIGSEVLDPRYGLNQGFDVYESPFGASRVRRDAPLVTRAALRWLLKNDAKPAFAFLHLYDLHTPYTLPQVAGLTPNVAAYDAELQYVDRTLGQFRAALTRAGLWDQAVIVIVGDHGESLGDHGETSHGYFVYESTIHVPLVVHWPEGSPKFPERIAEPGGLIDVAPALLDFLHIAAPPSFEGVSLLPGHGEHAVYSESVYPHQAFGWAPLRALRLGPLKYIDAPKPELYDLAKDPGERVNTIAMDPKEAASMKARIAELMNKYPPKPPPAGAPAISSRTKEVLGSLGYTAGGKQTSNHAAVDPKDRVAEAEAYESGLALLYSSRYDRAIQTFQRIVTRDPRNLPALCALGEAYLRSGNSTRALALWQQALEKDPNYQPAADSIGDYWLSRRNYEKGCRFEPAAPECARPK